MEDVEAEADAAELGPELPADAGLGTKPELG